MPEMSPESRDNTGRPNLGLSLAPYDRPAGLGAVAGWSPRHPDSGYNSTGSNDKEELLVLRLIRHIEDLMLAACMPLEAAKEVAEIRALWPRKTAQRPRWRQPGQRRWPYLAGAVAELSSEGATEARGVREGEVLGNRGDRLGDRGVGQDRMRF